MENPKEQLEAIKDMRNLMERSSRFLSLSGLSGVAIGIFALVGLSALYLKLDLSPFDNGFQEKMIALDGNYTDTIFQFVLIDALAILIASLIAGTWMSVNRSKKLNLPSWDPAARRLVINLMIPLVAGGLLCLIFIEKGELAYLAPITLLFYGLALVNASKYTVDEIRNLGIIEITLGLIAFWKIDFALLLWGIGFGILHIIYGIFIHTKQK
jgi:uncharacterized membrane protein YgdD (TMEM256/DUF423 family)